MKYILSATVAAMLLVGCSSEDADNAIVDVAGKNFETSAEQQVYAQYVTDSTAAIVDTIFQKGCITSRECSINGYTYSIDSRDYTLLSTTNVTVVKNEDVLSVSAKNTNPDQQIFLNDTNSNSSLVSVNLLDGTYSIEINGSSSPYTVTLHALYTDSQSAYSEQGLSFKAKTNSSFSFDSTTHTFVSGSATTTFKESATYQWGVDKSGLVFIK